MRPFERVHTMTDYYDGPRQGIADFEGKPHLYESRFDSGDGSDYELRAVDPETFRLALEDWEIWRRWEEAFYAGRTARETHPALPEDRARHDELAAVLSARFAALPGPVIRATAEFQRAPGPPRAGPWPPLEVRWTPAGR